MSSKFRVLFYITSVSLLVVSFWAVSSNRFTFINRAAGSLSQNLEEQLGWLTVCRVFAHPAPTIPCPVDTQSRNFIDKKSGKFSISLTGKKDKSIYFSKNFILKPSVKYKVSFWLKYKNRKIYNFLNLGYPNLYTNQTGHILKLTKGVWSGKYFATLELKNGAQSNNIQLLPGQSFASWSNQNRDWFKHTSQFQTTNQQNTAKLTFELRGFDGNLLIDDVALEEVQSHIDSKYFHMETPEFSNMRIRRVSNNPLFIETNSARFEFGSNSITMIKSPNSEVSRVQFPTDFLRNLNLTNETGNVYLQNSNIEISIGGDSVIIAKLKKQANIRVTGPKPNHHAFEAGIIFATNYQEGVFFSPIRPELDTKTFPATRNPQNSNPFYNDQDLERIGKKFWTVSPANFQDADANLPWNIEYRFNKDEGFITQVFPPKEFDQNKYCTERPELINPGSNPDRHENIINSFKTRFNIGIIWHSSYNLAQTDSRLNFYCVEKNSNPEKIVYCDENTNDPNLIKRELSRSDLAGPFKVGNPDTFRQFVNKSHEKGIKTLVYMTPYYYYTHDVDIFVNNLRQLVSDYNLDGVYFDGLYDADPLKSLELVRKVRKFLGNKYFIVHNSFDNQFTPRSAHYRVPFLDAYADMIWNGEGVKLADDNSWKLNYAGNNVSNTVSETLAEYRPVNYTESREVNDSLTMTGEQQADKAIENRGLYRSNRSSIIDKSYSWSKPYDTSYFWNKFNTACLTTTCGNNKCDIGENTSSCSQDCQTGTLTPTVSTTPSPNPSSPSPTPSGSCPNKPRGDANCDGNTDGIDYELWRREFLNEINTLSADFNNDTHVDGVDYELWRRGYIEFHPSSSTEQSDTTQPNTVDNDIPQ